MTSAFTVLNLKWNDEVVEYLATKFNSINSRIIVLSKTVLINATLAKFDNVSFIINGASQCLELSFAKADTDKMGHVIQEILKWDAFTKHTPRFCVKVEKDDSCSILFVNGEHSSFNDYKRYFKNYGFEKI